MADEIKKLEKTLDHQAEEEVVEIGPDGTIRTSAGQSLVPSGGKKTVLHDPRGEY